jgi:hypothetical protein
MKYIYLIFIFITVNTTAYCATLEQLAHVNSNGDSGIWIEETFLFHPNLSGSKQQSDGESSWLFTLHGEQRWGSRFQVQWYSEFQQVIQYDFASFLKDKFSSYNEEWFKHFYLGPGLIEYTQLSKQNYGPELTKWLWAIRPLIVVNILLNFCGWEFDQRIRLERQLYLNPFHHDYSNIRWRLDLYGPWKWTRFEIQPYISNEFFFRSKTYNPESNPTGLVGGLYDDLVRFGIVSKINKSISLEIYYQLEFLKQKISPTNSLEYWSTNNIGIVIVNDF